MRHHSAPQPTYIHVGTQTVSPVMEYVAPAPVMTDITSLLEPPVPLVLTEYVAPAPAATHVATASLVTVTEDVASAPIVSYTTPAPVIERPAPEIEYIAPSPAEFFPSFYPSFRLPNEAIAGAVNPQISISADETSQVVGLFPLLEDFVQPRPSGSLQQYRRMLLVKKFLSFQFWSGFKRELWRPSKWFHRSELRYR